MRNSETNLEKIFDQYVGKPEFPKRLDEFIRNQKKIGKPVHAKKLYYGIERALKEAFEDYDSNPTSLYTCLLILYQITRSDVCDEAHEVFIQLGLPDLVFQVFEWTLPYLDNKSYGETSQVYENILESVVEIINAVADFSTEGLHAVSSYFVPQCITLVADDRRRLVVRLEAAKFLNTVLDVYKANGNGGNLEPLGSLKFVKIFDQLLIGAGDLELQLCMCELLFRLLVSQVNRNAIAMFWFESCLQLRRAFVRIRDAEFESDCRKFLNKLNESQLEYRRVYSLPCKEVYIGAFKVRCATDGTDSWIDFNLGSKSVSFFACDAKDDNWETVIIKAARVIECRFHERQESNEIVMVLTMKDPVSSLLSFCPEQNESYVKFIYDQKNSPVTAANLVFPKRTGMALKLPISPDVIASTPPKTSVAINAIHLSSRSKGMAKTVPTVTRPKRKVAKISSSESAKSGGSEAENRDKGGCSWDTRGPIGQTKEYECRNDDMLINGVQNDEGNDMRDSQEDVDNVGTFDVSNGNVTIVIGDGDISGIGEHEVHEQDNHGLVDLEVIGETQTEIGMNEEEIGGKPSEVAIVEKEIGGKRNVGEMVKEKNRGKRNAAETGKEKNGGKKNAAEIGGEKNRGKRNAAATDKEKNVPEMDKRVVDENQSGAAGMSKASIGESLAEMDKEVITETQSVPGSPEDALVIEVHVGNTVVDNGSVAPSEKREAHNTDDKGTVQESDGNCGTSSTLEDTSTTRRGRSRKTRVPRRKPAPKKDKAKRPPISSTSESEPAERVKQTRCRTKVSQAKSVGDIARATKTAAPTERVSGYNTEDWWVGDTDTERSKQREKALSHLQEKSEGNLSQSRVALIKNVFRDAPRYSRVKSLGPFEFKCGPGPKTNKQGLRMLRSQKSLYGKGVKGPMAKKTLNSSKTGKRQCFSDIAPEAKQRQTMRMKANYHSEGVLRPRGGLESEQSVSPDQEKEKAPSDDEDNTTKKVDKTKKNKKAKENHDKVTKVSTNGRRKVKPSEKDDYQLTLPKDDFSITQMLMEANQLDDSVFEQDVNDLDGVEEQPFEIPLNDIVDQCLTESPRREDTLETKGSMCDHLESQTHSKIGENESPNKAGDDLEQNGIGEDNDENIDKTGTKGRRLRKNNVDVEKQSVKSKGPKRINEDKRESEEVQCEDDYEPGDTQFGSGNEDDEEEIGTKRETRTKVKYAPKINEKLNSSSNKTKVTKKVVAIKKRTVPGRRRRSPSPEVVAEHAEESDGESDEGRSPSRFGKNQKLVDEIDDEMQGDQAHLTEDDHDVCEGFRKNFAKILSDSIRNNPSSPRSARKKKTPSSSRTQEQRTAPKKVKSAAKSSLKSTTKAKAPLEQEEDMESNDDEEVNNDESPSRKDHFLMPADSFKFDVRTPKTIRAQCEDSGFVDKTPGSSSRKRTIDSRDRTPCGGGKKTSGARDETPGINATKSRRFGSLDVTPRKGYRSNEETISRALQQQEPAESLVASCQSQPSTKKRLYESKGKKREWNDETIGLVSGPFTANPERQRKKPVFSPLEVTETGDQDDIDDADDDHIDEDDDEDYDLGTPGADDLFVPIEPRKLFRSADCSGQTKKQRTSKQREDAENDDDILMEDTENGISIGDEVKFTLASLGQDMTKTIKKRQGYVNQMANSSMKLIMSQTQDIWEKHSSKRNGLVNDYSRRVNKYIQDHQDVSSRKQESEDKMLSQLRKHLETVGGQRKEQEKCLRNIVKTQKAFTEAFQELEEDSHSQETSLQNHLRKEMLRYRDQIVKDVQKQEIGTIKRRVQAMIGASL